MCSRVSLEDFDKSASHDSSRAWVPPLDLASMTCFLVRMPKQGYNYSRLPIRLLSIRKLIMAITGGEQHVVTLDIPTMMRDPSVTRRFLLVKPLLSGRHACTRYARSPRL